MLYNAVQTVCCTYVQYCTMSTTVCKCHSLSVGQNLLLVGVVVPNLDHKLIGLALELKVQGLVESGVPAMICTDTKRTQGE